MSSSDPANRYASLGVRSETPERAHGPQGQPPSFTLLLFVDLLTSLLMTVAEPQHQFFLTTYSSITLLHGDTPANFANQLGIGFRARDAVPWDAGPFSELRLIVGWKWPFYVKKNRKMMNWLDASS